MKSTKQKIVVFDLDETIGHFYLIRLLWDSVHHFIEYNNIPYMMDQTDFNNYVNENNTPYIIDKSGYYKLTENIETKFFPNILDSLKLRPIGLTFNQLTYNLLATCSIVDEINITLSIRCFSLNFISSSL